VRDGYSFSGWTPELPATMPDTDLILTGSWTKNSYTITYLDSD
jgi:hypothetical protein